MMFDLSIEKPGIDRFGQGKTRGQCLFRLKSLQMREKANGLFC